MALLDENDVNAPTHQTVEQYETHPHQPAKQQNYRIPANLVEAAEVLAADSGLTKNDIVNLALFNTLCSYGYENKKKVAVKKIKL